MTYEVQSHKQHNRKSASAASNRRGRRCFEMAASGIPGSLYIYMLLMHLGLDVFLNWTRRTSTRILDMRGVDHHD